MNPKPDKSWEALWWVWLASLTSSVGVGWTGMVLFDQPAPKVPGWVALVFIVFAPFLFFKPRRWRGMALILGASLLGLLFGSTFGLGFAQLFGLIFGSLDVVTSSRVVGLSVGLGAGLLLGRSSGLIGALLYISVFALAMGIDILGEVLLAWLVGMVSGGLTGSFSYLWLSSNEPPRFTQVYLYRFAFLWWFSRPMAPQVEAALAAQGGQAALLERLAKQRRQAKPPAYYVKRLDDSGWQDRFIARHALVALGTAGLSELQQLLQNSNLSTSLRRTSIWLARSIGWDTTQQLAHQAGQLLCIRCLTICVAHQAKSVTPTITYYGCRTCQQSTEFFQAPAGVVAVLDHHWNDKHYAEAGFLRVNVLAWRELFDFNEVEIIAATDEEVERFAVQVGNDTSLLRQLRYPKMVCRVAPTCQLSENTKRILERMFGRVEIAPLQKLTSSSTAKVKMKVDQHE
jgi:hypothetical protein